MAKASRISVLLTAAALGMAGCGSLLSHLALKPDSGTPASEGADCCVIQPLDDGGDDGGPDAAGLDAAVPPAFHWDRLPSLPPAASFKAVGGFTDADSGVNLFVTDTQKIYRLQRGSWSLVYSDGSGPFTTSLWASADGLVVTGGLGGVTACPTNCSADGGFTSTLISGIQAVCGNGTEAYAIGVQSSRGTLYHYSRADDFWTQISTDTGAIFPVACGVTTNDEVFIASRQQLVRTHLTAHSLDSIDYPPDWTTTQQDALRIYAFWSDGSKLLAAGKNRSVLSRSTGGTWSFLHGPDAGSSDQFRALAGVRVREVYAAGEGLARSAPAWENLPFDAGFIAAAWAAGPDELYLVGSTADGGLILRGFR